jgi:hypothetical protein
MEQYQKTNNTLKYTYKKLERYGFNSSIYIGNKGLQAIYLQQKKEFSNNDVCLVIVKLDFKDFICHKTPKDFKNMMCYFFEDNICYEIKLETVLKQNKTVFILFECINYLYWGPKYVTHSTCAIVHNKKCYFINSHGGCSRVIKHYVLKDDKFEKETVSNLKCCKDYFVISNIMKNFNIETKNTDAQMYYGSNLQEYDNHGCCFIFPMYIWYYFEKNVKNNTKLLEKGMLSLMVYNIFFRDRPIHDPKPSNSTINNYTKENIKRLKWRFYRNILNEFVGYMTQKKIQCCLR